MTHFLPAIQREFVWDPDRVVMLFDSVLRRYPIGSLLFWRLKNEHVGRWEFYEFVKNASQAGSRAETAHIAGVLNPVIVLDGQQRLTSLLIGLRGSYTLKRKHMRWSNPAAWEKRFLHLDLLKDPDLPLDDDEEGLRYGLAFLCKDPMNDAGRWWIPVAEILRCDGDSEYESYRAGVLKDVANAGIAGDLRILERNLDRLYEVVWREKSLAYYVEMDQDYDRVLDIFVRANQGAVRLSKSDLLLSMMTANWSGGDNGGARNARAEVYAFVDYINSGMSGRNNFDKDFVMKACLVLCDLPVAYKVKNFNKVNLERIESSWDAVKSAIERAVRFANHFGIDRDTLTSANALIPIAYFLLRHPGQVLTGTSASDALNGHLAHSWLGCALLNGAFGGQSDRALTVVREAILNTTGDAAFPVGQINAALDKQGRRATFDENTIGNVLDLRYGQSSSYLALSILHDATDLGLAVYHKDHIFPRSWFTRDRLEAVGIAAEECDRVIGLADTIANLQLLTERENLQKLARDPLEWTATRAEGFRHKHLIPEDDGLLRLENFERFIDARQGLIADRLRGLLAVGANA